MYQTSVASTAWLADAKSVGQQFGLQQLYLHHFGHPPDQPGGCPGLLWWSGCTKRALEKVRLI